MQDSVQIHALTARYRLPRRDASVEARLDRLLHRVLAETLEPALERAGVPLHAEVCVRSVVSRVGLDLDAADDELVLAWGLTLSQAIAAAAARPSAGILILGSRRHALVEFADDVAASDLTRAWAYRQLGLGDIARASFARRIELLLRALVSEPGSIAPVLVELARRDRLQIISAALTASQWLDLAIAAARTHGVPDAIEAVLSVMGRQELSSPAISSDDSPGDRSRPSSPGQRPLAGPLAAALMAEASRLVSPEARAAAAVLGAIAADPARPYDLASRAQAFAGVLSSTSAPPATTSSRPKVHSDPTKGITSHSSEAELAVGSDPVRGLSSLALRPHGDTCFGGLLFLVHIVDALGLVASRLGPTRFTARSSRWIFHQWALALIRIEPTDPAALAFAGLPPDARPPSIDEPPPDATEVERLAEDAQQIAVALHHRLGEPELSLTALVDRVCRKNARIIADPGWLEVHLSLRDVDTALRKAGLDIDPEFVPWLGTVIKFIYA